MMADFPNYRSIATELLNNRLGCEMAIPPGSNEWNEQTQVVYNTSMGIIAELLQAKGGISSIPEDFRKPYGVLQGWTNQISHRQQGVLVMALRGPDGLPKESGCKNLIRTYRACVMNSGDTKKPLARGEALLSVHDTYMTMQYITSVDAWAIETERFVKDVDTYNVHFLQHFLHGAMVIAYNHPDGYIAQCWLYFVNRLTRKLHIHAETKEEFLHRLRDGVRTVSEENA